LRRDRAEAGPRAVAKPSGHAAGRAGPPSWGRGTPRPLAGGQGGAGEPRRAGGRHAEHGEPRRGRAQGGGGASHAPATGRASAPGLPRSAAPGERRRVEEGKKGGERGEEEGGGGLTAAESHLEGVNRRNLKFIKLSTLQVGVSVRIKFESEREGENKSQANKSG
jgi:hypothetical protein